MGSKLETELGAPITATGDKTGQSFGRKLISGVGKVAAIGGGIGAALLGKSTLDAGWKRLTTIRDATAALTVSMGDAAKAGQFMDQIVQVVSGTPFNLDQFAKAGQQLVGFGVDAQKVPRMLTAIGEASATQGARAGESAGELASTFGKMAAIGKVSMQDMWSLSNVGVNGLKILGNAFGVTTDEMSKMISKGAVPADKALQALTDGILNGSQGVNGATVKLGGTMNALRETLSGASGGFKAAIARLGASIITPFEGIITRGLTGGASAIDAGGKLIQTILSKVVGSVSEALPKMQAFFTSGAGADAGAQTLAHLSSIWDTLGRTVAEVAPAVGDIVKSLGAATAAIGISAWQVLLATVDSLAKVFSAVLVPALQGLGNLMADNQTAVTLLVGAYTAWKAISIASSIYATMVSLSAQVAVLGLNTAAWVRNTIAMVASKAETLALAAMYAGEFLAGIARTTAALVLQTAAWVAQNVALVAYKAVQLAITAASYVWTAAQWLLNIALDANPIGLVIIAVAALIAIIVLIVSNLDWFRGIWDAVWKWCSDLITTVVGWIRGQWDGLWNWLTGLWSGIGGFFSGIWDGVVNGVRSAVGWVRDAWQGCIDGIKGIFRGLGDFARGVWDGIVSAAKNVINGAIGVINGAISGVNSVTSKVGIPGIPEIPKLAAGGVITRPTLALVGEAGDEAVIPLRRMHEFIGEAGPGNAEDGRAMRDTVAAGVASAVERGLARARFNLDSRGIATISTVGAALNHAR